MFVEAIGIVATLCVLAAFSMNGELTIRYINLLGAVLFVVYGFLIGSISVTVLNFALIILQIFKIIILKSKENKEDGSV